MCSFLFGLQEEEDEDDWARALPLILVDCFLRWSSAWHSKFQVDQSIDRRTYARPLVSSRRPPLISLRVLSSHLPPWARRHNLPLAEHSLHALPPQSTNQLKHDEARRPHHAGRARWVRRCGARPWGECPYSIHVIHLPASQPAGLPACLTQAAWGETEPARCMHLYCNPYTTLHSH